jgi:hypothetical protein
MTIGDLPLIAGALLIVAGIAQISVKMWREPSEMTRRRLNKDQRAHLGREGFKVQSAYPGMIMVCFGTVLLIAGHFLAR